MAPAAPSRRRSSATGLALAFAALVVYASLYPFSDWHWPGGAVHSYDLLRLPLPRTRWWGIFDVAANFAGYVPLGGLVYIAARRQHTSVGLSLWVAVGSSAGLSYLMEVTQHFLPHRYPSLLDWVLNTSGSAIGASLGWGLDRHAWLGRWHHWRERWFIQHSTGALVLLWLWPAALLFPAPAPLSLGPNWARIQDTLIDWLIDVPWAQAPLELITELTVSEARLPLLVEGFMVMLGLLCPCLLSHSITRTPWRRMAMVPALTGLAGLGATCSAALNFGLEHALAWVTPSVPAALTVAILLALGLAWVPQRLAAGLGLTGLALLCLLVMQAPEDPYLNQNIQGWEHSSFVRFHGLAQWVGWLWPLVAGGWLMRRLALPVRSRSSLFLPF